MNLLDAQLAAGVVVEAVVSAAVALAAASVAAVQEVAAPAVAGRKQKVFRDYADYNRRND